jgi:hypothetical protein
MGKWIIIPIFRMVAIYGKVGHYISIMIKIVSAYLGIHRFVVIIIAKIDR